MSDNIDAMTAMQKLWEQYLKQSDGYVWNKAKQEYEQIPKQIPKQFLNQIPNQNQNQIQNEIWNKSGINFWIIFGNSCMIFYQKSLENYTEFIQKIVQNYPSILWEKSEEKYDK